MYPKNVEYIKQYRHRKRKAYLNTAKSLLLGGLIIFSAYGVKSCQENIKQNKLEKQTEDVRIK